ncbi:MAG: hypothetical protein U0798_05205 [Gemmataceae bacterium]
MIRTPRAYALILIGLSLPLTGCGSKPDKATIEKNIRASLAKSPEWKDIVVEMKLDGTVTTAGANRQIDGKTYWFSFTGSDGNGGVAVRNPSGEWLSKYGYEKSKEVRAEKMTGQEEDIARFRTLASEFATACIAASS